MSEAGWSAEDLDDLRHAKRLLENPSLAARIAGVIGTPIEIGMGLLPKAAAEAINDAAYKALEKALGVAVWTMGEEPKEPTNWLHKLMVALTGAGGGAFGLASLAVELPVSTTIMLRSVADVARGEGENVKSPAAKLACLEVFALGGRSVTDDAAESGYFAVRLGLAQAMRDATEYLARGMGSQTAPQVVRFITQVATRFSIPVSEKAVAQSLPILGALGGGVINVLFIDHFQDIARGHFTVRRLERTYGAEVVKREYLKLPAEPRRRPAIASDGTEAPGPA